MATANRVEYTIGAKSEGLEDVQRLAKSLDDVGQEADDLRAKAAPLAQQLERVADQQQAITTLRQLGQESRQLAQALENASSAVDGTAAELAASSAATQRFATAQQAVEASLASTRAELVQQRQALTQLKAGTDAAARGTDEYKASVTAARARIAELREAVKAKRTELAQSKTVTAQAAAEEKNLQQAYDAAVASARKTSAAYGANRRAMQEASEAAQALGIDTQKLGAAQQKVQQEAQQARQSLSAYALAVKDAVEKSKALEASTRAQAAASAGAAAAVNGQAASIAKMGAGTDALAAKLGELRNVVGAVFGVQIGANLVSDLAKTADAYSNLSARIKISTGEGAAFEAAMVGVQQVAVATRSNLEETANLYTRISEAGKTLKLSQDQVLGLVQTINQATQLSGGSAESAQAAITQLNQALQSGVLRGEEFNSIMEQAPRLSRALADGLGVSIGKLREMAEAGRLSSEVVITALRGQADAVAEEFAKLPPTIGAALQNLSTAWTVYIGQSDQASGASRLAADAISLLSNNLKEVADFLLGAGQAAGALYAINLAERFLGIGQAASVGAAQIAGNTTATVANAAATTENTAAQTAHAGASMQDAAATTADTAATTANTTATAANTASQAASTAATSRNAESWKALGTELGNTSTKAAGTAGAMTTVASETGRAGAAAAEAAAKKGLLSTALAGAGAAARGFMALLGGPLGLIALTAMFAKDIGELAGRFSLWITGQKTLEQSTKELADAQKREADIAKEVAAAREKQQAADKAATAAQFGLTDGANALIGKFDDLIKKGSSTDEAITSIAKDFDLSSVPGIRSAAGVLDKLASDGKITADQVQAAWAESLKGEDLGKWEVRVRQAFAFAEQEAQRAAKAVEDALAKGVNGKELDELRKKAALAAAEVGKASERMKAAMDAGVREAVRRTGLDWDVLSGKIGAASRSAINDVQALQDGIATMKAEGVDTGRVLTASLSKAIQTADSQAAIDALTGKVNELRGELGDKVADGLLDQAKKQAEELSDALDAATPGINSVREAFKSLGIESDAALKEKAKTAKEAYDTIKSSGTASAREINESWKAMAEASIKANDGVADATVKAQASAHGFAIETDAAGKSVVKSLGEAKGAAKGVGDALGAAGEEGRDALGKIDYGAKMAGKSLEELNKITEKNWDANRDLADQAAEHNAAANESVNAWRKQQQEQNKYYGEMVKILQKTRMGFAELNKAAWAGANALEALDKQQKAIEQSSGGAAKELQDMRDKLAELDGDEETTARRRADRDKAEVQRKQALMQLDLQRAQIRKDDDEVARLTAELAAYQEQLRLIDQIAAKESQARQRKEREEKAAQRERDRAQEDAQKSRMDGVAEEGAARDAEAERLAQEAQKKLEDEMRKRQQAEDEALRKKRAAEDKAASERAAKERKALDDAEKQRQEALRREAEARAEARRQEDERIRQAEAARVAREKADRDAAAKAAEAQEAQRADREAKAKKGTRSTEEDAALARQRDAVLAAQKQQAEEQARLEAERAEAAAQARAKRLQDERSAEDKAAAERERIASEAHQRRLQELEEAERKRQERVQEERAREDERIAAQRERDAAMLKAMQDVAASVLAIAQASGAKVPLGGAQTGPASAPGQGGAVLGRDAASAGNGGGGGVDAGASRPGISYVSNITIPGAKKPVSVAFADSASQGHVTALLRQLADSRGAAL